MGGFVVRLLIGVALATGAAMGLARALLPASSWEQANGATVFGQSTVGQPGTDGAAANVVPFTQQEAVEVVAARLGGSPGASRHRQTLRSGAAVQYHSPGHWTVRLAAASWTAHGNGRYAEPDNDAARQFEAEALAS